MNFHLHDASTIALFLTIVRYNQIASATQNVVILAALFFDAAFGLLEIKNGNPEIPTSILGYTKDRINISIKPSPQKSMAKMINTENDES